MTYRVIFTDPAAIQLQAASDWWAEHRSLEQAARWYVGFSDAIYSLADNPHGCAVARENANFLYEVRELLFGLGSRPTHRAVFTIRPDTVIVLAIRHAAQDELTPEDV